MKLGWRLSLFRLQGKLPKEGAYACEIASDGQAAAQEPQSMQVSASIL